MKYQDEIRKAAILDLEKTIGFNKGKWSERDVLCYRTAFEHGLGVAMRWSGVPTRVFNAKGKQIN